MVTTPEEKRAYFREWERRQRAMGKRRGGRHRPHYYRDYEKKNRPERRARFFEAKWREEEDKRVMAFLKGHK